MSLNDTIIDAKDSVAGDPPTLKQVETEAAALSLKCDLGNTVSTPLVQSDFDTRYDYVFGPNWISSYESRVLMWNSSTPPADTAAAATTDAAADAPAADAADATEAPASNAADGAPTDVAKTATVAAAAVAAAVGVIALVSSIARWTSR